MATTQQQPVPGKEMPLSGHLTELRNRLMVCVVCFVVCFIAWLTFAPQLVEFLTDMGKAYGYRYVYIAPQELLMQHFSLAMLAAVVCTSPVLLYQIWAFIRPGLSKKENLCFVLAVAFGLVCFVVGVLFAYHIMLPFMLRFLIGVSAGTEISAAITVANYIGFLLTMFIIFGLVFEFPLVSVLLTQMGLFKVEWMKKGFRVAVVLIFVAAAIITPPDIVSQIMVAIPMILLYQLSIMLCSFLMHFRRPADPAGDDAADEAGEGDEAEKATAQPSA